MAATLELADLRVIDFHTKGVLGLGHVVGAGLASEFHGDVGAGGVVLGIVGPGIAGRIGLVGDDVGGIENDGRIADAIEALRSFHAETERPGGLIAVGDDEDRIVMRDRRRNGLLHGRLRWRGIGGFGSRLLRRGLRVYGDAEEGRDKEAGKKLSNAHEIPCVLPRMRCEAVAETPPGTGRRERTRED